MACPEIWHDEMERDLAVKVGSNHPDGSQKEGMAMMQWVCSTSEKQGKTMSTSKVCRSLVELRPKSHKSNQPLIPFPETSRETKGHHPKDQKIWRTLLLFRGLSEPNPPLVDSRGVEDRAETTILMRGNTF